VKNNEAPTELEIIKFARSQWYFCIPELAFLTSFSMPLMETTSTTKFMLVIFLIFLLIETQQKIFLKNNCKSDLSSYPAPH